MVCMPNDALTWVVSLWEKMSFFMYMLSCKCIIIIEGD